MDLLGSLALIAAVLLFLYWLSGKYIDDVLESADDVWTRAWARERLGREAQNRRRR